METSTDPTEDVQVQNQAENHMETPTDPTDDVQAQNQAAICIEVPQGIRDIRRAANRSRNHLQDGRDVRNLREVNRPGRPARRTNTERQPQQRQGWHWNRIYPRGEFRPQQIRYTGGEKIFQQLPRNPSVEDFFKLYITEEIIDVLVTQTNLYARQYLERERVNLRPHSTAHEWKPTDRPEMLTFLALMILMGIVHKPRLTMYWSKDNIMATPIFNQVMRRDRFLLLLRFLHFADNSRYNPNDPDRDRLYKLREVVDMIKNSCGNAYSPGKNLSMDESLVLFKGRLSFKQYISSKRARFGIKLYQLCTFNGILVDFLVYHGNIAPVLTRMADDSLVTERIPVTLMQSHLNKGHHIFMDNFYTSLPVAEYFLQHGTHVTGTIRDNRKHFPTELKSLALDKGAAAFYQHDGLMIAKYRALKDRASGKPKVVCVLSTAHTPAMGNTNKRDREGNIVQKPTCIISYNHNMGGVDMMDQQLDGIDVLRKSYKWYKKLFMRLVMQCALSSHKLYKLNGGRDTFLYFLLDVCTHLLFNSPRLISRRPVIDNIARLTGRNHWPGKRETPEGWKDSKSKVKMCRVCNAKGRKTRRGKEIKTTWICKGCPGEPGLCADKDCFEIYHTKFDFSL